MTIIAVLATFLAAGCSCGVLDKGGQQDPDAGDADDPADVLLETDVTDMPLDPDVTTDTPVDPVEEEGGCTSDDDCDDLEACNGLETCGEDGECHDGTPLADGMPCVSPSGIEGICNAEVCRPPGCGDGIASGDEECDDENTVSGDGCENDCTFTCHGAADCNDADVCTDDACIAGGTGQICDNPYNTAPCNDSNPCSHTDTCDGAGNCTGVGYSCTLGVCEATSTCDGSGGCTVTYSGPGTGCNDLDPCTHTDQCDGAGTCSGTGYSCTPGICETASDCDGMGGCTPTYAGPGTACTDAWSCTTGETCDGAGHCTGGTPDDALCSSGQICRPACFPSTGCGTPPGFLDVSCPDLVTLPATASCSISLDSMAGQAGCLRCSTEVGRAILANDSFGGASGSCDMSGWSLVTGPNCRDRIDEGGPCTPGGAVRTCCAASSTLLTRLDGDCMLRTDRGENCGDDSREWRIQKTLDTRGLVSVEVCYRVAHDGATPNDGILLLAEDATHSERILPCVMGPIIDNHTTNMEWPYCHNLPTWTHNNPALRLVFIGHSHDNGDRLYLDDIVVSAWPSGCTPGPTRVFGEDFDPCPSVLPNGWNGWTITSDGGGPLCGAYCGSPGGASADDETWSMTHDVDTSTLDGDVTLIFSLADHRCDGSEWIRVSFDASDGTGWQEAWYWEEEFGPDDACRKMSLNLSDIDPDVNRNPDLRIRFEIRSDAHDRNIYIDDVTVEGAQFCPGASHFSVSTIGDDGGGSYSFTLSSRTAVPSAAYVTCSWDTPPDPITDTDSTRFVSP
jgi:hypothetical protein